MTRPIQLVSSELAHRAPVDTAEHDSANQGAMPVSARLPASMTPRAPGRRKWLFAIAAGAFVSWLLLGNWGGYRGAPLLSIELAAILAPYLGFLILLFWVRQNRSSRKAQTAKQSGAAVVADRLLGVSISEIGRAAPGSIDTAMHLELGTLSPGHLGQGAGTSLWQPHGGDGQRAETELPLPRRKVSNA